MAPYGIQQITFRDQHSWLARQCAEYGERLGGERDGRPVATKPGVGLVQLERIKTYTQWLVASCQHPPARILLPDGMVIDP